MKIYLSPSMQEKNIGKGTYGTEEQRMNDIADVLQKLLIDAGYTVYRNKPEMTLEQCVKDSNSKQVDLHLALHSNASNGTARGCEIYCHKFNTFGHEIAKTLYKHLEELTPVVDRGVKQGFNFYGQGKHMYELAYTSAPAVLIEIDFHDNIEGANWIISHKTMIAKTIVKALNEHFNINNSYVESIDYKIKYDKLIDELELLIKKYS